MREMREQMPNRTTLTRAELYDLVWKTPMNRLARTFGLSDQGLAKICKRHDVPRPRQGYWNKLAVGKPVMVDELPPLRKGISDKIVLSASEPAAALPPAVDAELSAAKIKASKVRVAERMVRPHPIIATWNARRDKEIASRDQVYDFRLRRLGKPTGFTPMERRCHRLLDAILKALETQEIKVTESERREIIATSGREKIEVQARVKLQQVRRPLTEDERHWRSAGDKDFRIEMAETDIVIFEIKTYLPSGLKRMWQDSRKATLEELAGEIIATLIAAFPLMRAAREASEEQARLHQIEQQRRYAEEQIRKLDRDRYRRLLEHAQRWKDAHLAREYLEALKAAAIDKGTVIDAKDGGDWLAWAEASIERRLAVESDPAVVFQSIAEVTNYSYRDR